ncbi:MAG: NAD(P)-dependent glycerol-3-phosphate dehydrogenase [bacterium]|nr:NAD(P)-dependent glycerol-3-phosphate dehydrogenase [bacterium]
MRIAVIGAGSWGTAVADIVARKQPVTLWARRPELAEAINTTRVNPDYLPDHTLSERVTSTADLEKALAAADALVMGVPSHGFRSVLEQCSDQISPNTPILSLAKGVEKDSLMRMTEVTADVLPSHRRDRIGVLTGPNLAKEIVAGQPAATVIAMEDEEAAKGLQQVFINRSFRVYTNDDVIGSEAAGALKNVMAIAAGMAHGLGFGDNTMATLITRALAELTRIGIAMGGRPLTFAGLAGTGDLIATCMSSQSRNHTVGYGLGKGKKLDEIIAEMNQVAEGVKSTPGILALADRHEIEMPIAVQVARVLYEGASPAEAVANLMGREAKPEMHGIG